MLGAELPLRGDGRKTFSFCTKSVIKSCAADSEMKLLVFAHTPPPHHGQSYMVQLMLNGFGGDQRQSHRLGIAKTSPYGITCYHVNAQVSKQLEDIGNFRPGKLFLLVGFCLQAIWCHF